MAMMRALLVAAIALALAVCRSPDAERLGTVVQNGCDKCKDPEDTADQSYVSIGVMPAPYPIDWGSPNKVFGTTIATSAVAKFLTKPVHDIGHVLLKVRCGSTPEFYISQTGALEDPKDPNKQLRQLQKIRVNMLFETFEEDGKLDLNAAKDWDDSAAAQTKLDGGTYDSNPAGLVGLIIKNLPDLVDNDEKDQLEAFIKDLKKVPRHRFVKATIWINENQCEAIRTWKDAYVANQASKRYAMHRAPWVMDDAKNYDGGACGSVSFAGAFYATGLDYKKVAPRVTERLSIGTARLAQSIARDNRKLEGWYSLQDDKRYVPGAVPCAKQGEECKAKGKKWFDALYDQWTGAEDDKATFSKAWGTGKNVESTTVPLVGFEPEKFYQEIRKRLTQPNHDAFAYAGWCKMDSKVPTIVLDARTDAGGKDRTGRTEGLKGGFDNAEVKLF